MANTHRLYFLRYLTMNDWNDLYHSSNSFLYSLKNSYIKNLKKPNNIKSKHLILYETLISNQILLNKDLDELELLLQSEVAKTYTITKNAFDKDLSRFLKNVDDFLAEKKLIYYSSEYEKQVALLHFFLQEKEDVQVDKKLVDIEKALTSNSKKLDSNNSFEKYKFYNKKAGILKYRKIEDFPLYIDKAFNSLNNFYISNVYKNACASIITNLNYKTNFKPKELPIFPQKIITDEICLGYYNAYEILLKIYNNKQEFIKLETIQKLLHPILYFESRKIYSIEDVKTLYMIKLNICVYLLAYSHDFAKEFKTTLEEMIAQNLIFENKIIDARLFKKVIEVYSISGFQKEAGLFFEHYKLDINSEVRAQYLCYSNALIDFYNKKFSTETISKLQEQKQLKHNPQLYLSIKSLLLKFHFEKENFDDYDSMIDTTIRYLDRKNNDLHMSTIEDFKNFLNILKFISSNSLKNKKFKEELNKKIKNPLSMLDKKWILEKYIL